MRASSFHDCNVNDALTFSFSLPFQEVCLEVFGFPEYPCISYDVQQDVALISVAPSESGITTRDGEHDIQLPSYSQRLETLAAQTPVGTKTVALVQASSFPLFQIPYEGDFVPPGVAFGINDRLFNPTKPSGTVTAGDCETWIVTSNAPALMHSFHIHGAHFLVTEQDSVAVEKPFWRDTMPVYHNLTLHVCYDLVEPGDSVIYHCHAASHLDIGMAAFLEVVAPEEDDEEESSGTWSAEAAFSSLLTASIIALFVF